MLVKRVLFQQQHEECTIEEISPSFSLTKTASECSLEIQKFITDHISPDPEHVYLLLTALGAGEIWGPNVNGDYFPEDDILSSYKTFETFGHVYVHHKNKDPLKASGSVMLSHWNPRMRRVELIVKLNRAKAPQIARDADNGKMWDVSMGCKVKFDVCSICGNKAFTRDQYCVHLKNHMCEVLPDGRQVYAINPNPRFFDISFVWIGADRTAKALAKVASAKGFQKLSDIQKDIPAIPLSSEATHLASTFMREMVEFKKKEDPLPKSIIESEHSLSDLLTTLASLGIVLTPEEFSEALETREAPKGEDLLRGEIKEDLVGASIPLLEKRSALRPYLLPRMVKLSKAKKKKTVFAKRKFTLPALVALHTLYGTYLDHLPDFNAEGLDAVFKKHPSLLPLVTAGTVGLTWGMGARDNTNREDMHPQSMEKVARDLGGRIFVGIPAAYLLSNIAQRWEDDNKFARFLAKHPALVAMLGIGATNTADDWAILGKTLSSFDKSNKADFGFGFGKQASVSLASSKTTEELYGEYKAASKVASVNVIISKTTEPWQEPGAVALAALATFNSKGVET